MRHNEPKIGLWGTICCEEDAHQMTAEDIGDYYECLRIDGFSGYQAYFFDTKGELLDWLKALPQ